MPRICVNEAVHCDALHHHNRSEYRMSGKFRLKVTYLPKEQP